MDRQFGQALADIEQITNILIERHNDDRYTLRAAKETLSQMRDFASGEAFATLFKELLLVIDRLNAEELTDELRSSVVDEIVSVCERYGLEPIAVLDSFDPKTQEVTGVVETEELSLDGKVAHVERSGYRLANRVLRPARVLLWRYAGEK